jgi:hypothetical protein
MYKNEFTIKKEYNQYFRKGYFGHFLLVNLMQWIKEREALLTSA